MDIYLAGVCGLRTLVESGRISIDGVSILESFYDCQHSKWIPSQIPRFGKFLLDSGAFTFLRTKKDAKLDWNDYADRYAAFINQHKVDRFFELDIDPLIGLANVEKLRNRIENRTGKQTIPVWHISRGKDYFLHLCKNYKYIAIGGLITDGLSRATIDKYIKWFIDQSHKYDCKIHGLGYTSTANLKRFRFDSVDSTSWKVSGRAGFVAKFYPEEGCIKTIHKPPGTRMKDYKEIFVQCYKEWVKFQQYAKKNL